MLGRVRPVRESVWTYSTVALPTRRALALASLFPGRDLLAHAGEQRRLPFQLRSERLDRPQRRRTDVVLHSFHVPVDHLLIQPEQAQEIGEKLVSPRDIASQRL